MSLSVLGYSIRKGFVGSWVFLGRVLREGLAFFDGGFIFEEWDK